MWTSGSGIGPCPHTAAVLGTECRSLASLLQAPPPPSLPCSSAAQRPSQRLCSGAGAARGAPPPPCTRPVRHRAAVLQLFPGEVGAGVSPPGGLLELRLAPQLRSGFIPREGRPVARGFAGAQICLQSLSSRVKSCCDSCCPWRKPAPPFKVPLEALITLPLPGHRPFILNLCPGGVLLGVFCPWALAPLCVHPLPERPLPIQGPWLRQVPCRGSLGGWGGEAVRPRGSGWGAPRALMWLHPQVRQAAAAPARPALHWPQVPGAPLLLQAHRGHAHRHLPHGDAGGPTPDDLGPRFRPAPPSARLALGAWPAAAESVLQAALLVFHTTRLDPAAGIPGRPPERQEPV